MTKINYIAFSIDRYNNDRDKMFQAIAKQIALLTENEYVCKVYDDDCGVVVIEFELDQRQEYYGCPMLMWLEEDEVDVIEAYRADKENDTK